MRLAAAVLLLQFPIRAVAQEPAPLAAGARVRLFWADPATKARVGVFKGLENGALLLHSGGPTRPFPVSTLARLEVSRGRTTSRLGLVLGVIVGGAVGLGAGCLASPDDYGVFCGSTNGSEKVVLGTALGAVVGAVIGSRIGRGDRWEPVDLGRYRP
ncbi:MAG: glycine zipper 2TM domain-containing protein [Gemmatimonadales bacterium]